MPFPIGFPKALLFIFSGVVLFSHLPSASGQPYPNKPVIIYCGYPAGASTDLTTRGLADGAEKMLGAPFVVETKTGGGATVAAALVASKNPDGYTLGTISTGALTLRPHMLKVAYHPLKDFTVLMQYSRYIGGICVLNDFPAKTIEEFVAYARVHPGLSYGSPGMFSQQHLAVELFAQAKGLKFKHVPTKGGIEAITQLLGKHTDFLAGGGQHVTYVRQGAFRLLVQLNADKRDPKFPGVPVLKEIDCPDSPALGFIVVGPKGMPEEVCKKLGETFKKIADTPAFQKILESFDIPYDYKDQTQLAKDIPAEYEWFRVFLEKFGAQKTN